MADKLTLGFSPCPNDTFIFDALVNKKIDTQGLEFDVVLADVEELNQMALKGVLDITKLSFHALAYVLPTYSICPSGSALGRNCGPLLVGREKLDPESLHEATVAIPGQYTTANYLLQYAFPNIKKTINYLFSDIEMAVIQGKTNIGLIIHENRFTFEKLGLKKLADLGEIWELRTRYPIPLGGIGLKRTLNPEIKAQFQRLLQESITYAKQNSASALSNFVKDHAQAMETNVMRQHIDLYVSDFTYDLASEGKEAVRHMIQEGQMRGVLPKYNMPLFSDEE